MVPYFTTVRDAELLQYWKNLKTLVSQKGNKAI